MIKQTKWNQLLHLLSSDDTFSNAQKKWTLFPFLNEVENLFSKLNYLNEKKYINNVFDNIKSTFLFLDNKVI